MNERKKNKIWIAATLGIALAALIMIAAETIRVDPLFHYHAPRSDLAYPLQDERYINDGISRHFSYDSVITGTSMTQNFKVSQAEELFGGKWIKIPYAGAMFKEVNDALGRIYHRGGKLSYVVRGLDYDKLIWEKDALSYECPEYLYNDTYFDDIAYLLNKEMFLSKVCKVYEQTETLGISNNLDDYANWSDDYTYGKEEVLKTYLHPEPAANPNLTEEEQIMVRENIRQNVAELAAAHPETEFYLFFTPYSICYWDELQTAGAIERHLGAEKITIEELVGYANVHLYSFSNCFDLVCDLDNYKDTHHYGEWVNEWILEQMQSETYRLTEDNYMAYLESIREFYQNYDYAALHGER